MSEKVSSSSGQLIDPSYIEMGSSYNKGKNNNNNNNNNTYPADNQQLTESQSLFGSGTHPHLYAIVVLFIAIDFLYCILYVIERFEPQSDEALRQDFFRTYRPTWMRILLIVLSFLTLIFLFIKIYFAPVRRYAAFSISTFIDLVTFIIIFDVSPNTKLQLIYVPYFLRSFNLTEKVRTLTELSFSGEDNARDIYKEQITSFVFRGVGYLYTFACFINWSETAFSERVLTFWNSCWFVIVTAATVGYGDITPIAPLSKVITALLIIIGVILLPRQVSQLMFAMSLRQDNGGRYHPRLFSPKKHIIFCGNFPSDVFLVDVLNYFSKLTKNEYADQFDLIILSPQQPSNSTKALLNTPFFRSFVKYIVGSPMNRDDLKRVKMDTAHACVVASEIHSRTVDEADEKNALAIWSIKDLFPNVPIYGINLKPQTMVLTQGYCRKTIYSQMTKHILLASNCTVRGSLTFLCNLFKQSHNYTFPTLGSWVSEYSAGLNCEVFQKNVPDQFIGKSFQLAAEDAYFYHGIVLIGVKIMVESQYHIMLNPASYVIKDNDILFYIAQEENSIFKTNTGDIKKPSIPEKEQSLTLDQSKVAELSRIEMNWDETVHIGSPAFSKKHEIKIKCYLLKERKHLDDCLVEDASKFTKHVILIAEGYSLRDLFTFCSTMRSASLPKSQIRQIVIMINSKPDETDWKALAFFPLINVIIGDQRRHSDLLRSGCENASRIVIFSDRHKWSSIPTESSFVDSTAVMTTHKIWSMYDQRRLVTTELIDRTNWKHIPPKIETNKLDDLLGYKYLYSPAYASGRVLFHTLIDSLLYQSIFGRADIVELIHSMAGFRRDTNDAIESKINTKSSSLGLISIPTEIATQISMGIEVTFDQVFYFLLSRHSTVAMGILRAKNESLQNDFSCVVTKPKGSTRLFSKDRIYVLYHLDDEPKIN